MRFRIMMTTFAAMLGALPLALGAGDGVNRTRSGLRSSAVYC
jgi:multidrug efflux pump subunit AcrB